MNILKIIFLVGVIFTLTACEKEEGGELEITKEHLLGKWRWVKSTGGITGKDVRTPATTGYHRTMDFGEDDTVRIFLDDSLTAKVHYLLLELEKVNDTTRSSWLLFFFQSFKEKEDSLYIQRYFIEQLSCCKLILQDYGADGYVHFWKR